MKGYRTSIPEEAEELQGFFDDATGKFLPDRNQPKHGGFFCVLNGEIIGYRYREEEGYVSKEYPIKDGKTHGYCRYWHEDGLLEWHCRR